MSFVGKKNVYLCKDCGHGFITQDMAEGVTPFTTGCLNCNGHAMSLMYNVPQEILGKPAVQWVRPPKDLWHKLPLGYQSHLEKGGLLRGDNEALKALEK